MFIREEVLNFIKSSKKDVSLEQVFNKFNVIAEERDEFEKSFLNLLFQGLIIETDEGFFISIENTNVRLCKVTTKKNGYIFATELLSKEELNLKGKEIQTILPGDLIYVMFKTTNHPTYFFTLKENEYLKGTYFKDQKEDCLRLLISDPYNYKAVITNFRNVEAKAGDIINCKIKSRRFNSNLNRLDIELDAKELLVDSNEVGSDISTIISSYDAPMVFPQAVLDQVVTIPKEVSKSDLKSRIDYRDEIVVTIDGADALDFDDAISIKKNKNGSFNLTVHIADVSNYVKEDSPLDIEALNRGTSIYVADRVVPMLPFELSNGICSLNPGVDRLVLSVEMLVDNDGRVLQSKVNPGVINSFARLTYDEVNKFIQNKDSSELKDEVKKMLEVAYECSQKIRRRREVNGAMKLESDEIKFSLDEKGYPVRVDIKKQGEGEKLIEDFMIATNVAVALYMEERGVPALFRIHEKPPRQKQGTLRNFLNKIDLLKVYPKELTSKNISSFIENIEDLEIRKIVSKFVLRSMSKAKYSPENIGHFGLAEEDYLHFTSPIRRYPDLIVHRYIRKYIFEEQNFKENFLTGVLEEVGELCSETERRAQQIEYDVIDLETCKFFENKIGYKYHAVIDGFNSHGIFIKTDIGLEGFLSFMYMEDDHYLFNEKKYDVMARVSRTIYNIGDKIDVCVLRVEKDRNSVTFCLPTFYERLCSNLSAKEMEQVKANDENVFIESNYLRQRRNKLLADRRTPIYEKYKKNENKRKVLKEASKSKKPNNRRSDKHLKKGKDRKSKGGRKR